MWQESLFVLCKHGTLQLRARAKETKINNKWCEPNALTIDNARMQDRHGLLCTNVDWKELREKEKKKKKKERKKERRISSCCLDPVSNSDLFIDAPVRYPLGHGRPKGARSFGFSRTPVVATQTVVATLCPSSYRPVVRGDWRRAYDQHIVCKSIATLCPSSHRQVVRGDWCRACDLHIGCKSIATAIGVGQGVQGRWE